MGQHQHQVGQQHLDLQGGMEVLRDENENLISEISNLQERYESLKLENCALVSRVKVLEIRAPKDELVKQNANLVAKVTKYKAIHALKGLEVIELKIIKEKYNLLMRKFGSNLQQQKSSETREEIVDGLANDLKDFIISFNRKHYSDIECQQFALLLFLEMCGASQLNLMAKMLKFTSQGIRIAVSNILKRHIASKNENLNIRETMENTPDQKGVSGVNGQNAPTKKAEFDKTKFLNGENMNCSFINEDLLTYISVIGDKKKIMKHKKSGQHCCQLPTCDAPFIMGQTMIGPVRIAAPNTAPGYGSVLWVCRKHVVASIDGRDHSHDHAHAVRNLFDVAPEDYDGEFEEEFDGSFDVAFEQDTTANAEGFVGDGNAQMDVGVTGDVDEHVHDQEAVNDVHEGVVENIDVEEGHGELNADQEVLEESDVDMPTNTLQDFSSSPRLDDGLESNSIDGDVNEGMEESANTSSSSIEM